MKFSLIIWLACSIAPALRCSDLTERSPIAPRQTQSPYATLQNSDNPSCCTSIGLQQCLYKNNCRCEHPCVFFAVAGCAGDAAVIGVVSAASCGALPLTGALPIAICAGIPSLLLTYCATHETYKRCTSNNTNQLDYLTDQQNWPKQKTESDHSVPAFDYDSGYDS